MRIESTKNSSRVNIVVDLKVDRLLTLQGVRKYSPRWGQFLKCFGIVSVIKDERGEKFYVNRASLIKHLGEAATQSSASKSKKVLKAIKLSRGVITGKLLSKAVSGLLPAPKVEAPKVETDPFLTVPEEVINKVFALFPKNQLSGFAQVNKKFGACATGDVIWNQHCLNDLPEEVCKAKPEDMSWQSYYLDQTTFQFPRTGEIGTLGCDTKMRERVEKLHLENYKLLNKNEVEELFKEPNTKALIEGVSLGLHNGAPAQLGGQKRWRDIKYVARQEVGGNRFDIICNSHHIFSLDNNRGLHINGIATQASFTPDDCQIWLTIYEGLHNYHFRLSNRDRGENKPTAHPFLTYQAYYEDFV